MMTLSVFAQLLKDPQKQEDYYKGFLNKYRSKFDSTISIRFSSEKYTDVDVISIFYDNFKEFVIEDLTSIKDNVWSDNWVYDLAERRVKKIRSKTDREAAKILIQKGGSQNWRYVCEIISKEFQDTARNVVTSCFNDDKYKSRKKDIPTILLNLFFLERANNPTPVILRESFENWLCTCLRNLANKKRKDIDTEIGAGDGNTVSPDSSSNGDVKDTNSFPPDSTDYAIDNTTQSSTDNTFEGDADSEPETKESLPEIDIIDSFQDDGAETELMNLLSLMPNIEYADLIRAIKIEHVPVDVIAEERECTNAAIYNQMNEAMTMLMRVALPEIQARCRKIYRRSISYMKPGYYRIILKEFFDERKSVEALATEHRKMPKVISSDLIKAYKTIKRIYNELEPETFLSKEEQSQIISELETSNSKLYFNENSMREKYLTPYLQNRENISDNKAKDYLQKFLVEKISISDIANNNNESIESCYKFLRKAFNQIIC